MTIKVEQRSLPLSKFLNNSVPRSAVIARPATKRFHPSCGGVLSTVDMVVQRRDGPRRLRDDDDNDDN